MKHQIFDIVEVSKIYSHERDLFQLPMGFIPSLMRVSSYVEVTFSFYPWPLPRYHPPPMSPPSSLFALCCCCCSCSYSSSMLIIVCFVSFWFFFSFSSYIGAFFFLLWSYSHKQGIDLCFKICCKLLTWKTMWIKSF